MSGSKIAYELIIGEINKIIIKMTIATNLEEIAFWQEAYVSLLEASGWNVLEFENEMLKRVDEGWDESKREWN